MFHVLQPPVTHVHEQIVIAPHHPDRLRRPAARAGAVMDERFHQTLTWNVFRTLELLPAPFWLRRLHARLGGDSFPAAPQILQVHLWQALILPPAQRINGVCPDVVVDVVIETEHALWTLMMCGDDRTRCLEADASGSDPAARAIDAGAWRAGTRSCYFGIIESATSQASVATLLQRYSRSRDSMEIRSGVRQSGLRNVRAVGVVRWTDLSAILGDCEQARVLTEIERALARNVMRWLERVGLPSTDRSLT
jgi:hypothetical protein